MKIIADCKNSDKWQKKQAIEARASAGSLESRLWVPSLAASAAPAPEGRIALAF
jgi:hypothetical protein